MFNYISGYHTIIILGLTGYIVSKNVFGVSDLYHRLLAKVASVSYQQHIVMNNIMQS